MSTSVNDDAQARGTPAAAALQAQKRAVAPDGNYKGFVAGVFSGIAKLSGESARLVPKEDTSLTPPSRPSLRHDQSTVTDFEHRTIQRAIGMSQADIEK